MTKSLKTIMALSASLMIIAGCTTTERQIAGAGIGGVGGALIGDAVGGTGGAVVGGLGGAAAGALVGGRTGGRRY